MATWGPTSIAATIDDAIESVGVGVYSAPLDSDGFVVGGRSSVYNHAILRFLNVTIPKGATINSATLEVYVSYQTGGAFNVEVYAEDADNSAEVDTEDVDNITTRDKTTASVTWAFPQIDGSYEVTDPKTAIEEVIARDGWASGNALSIILWSDNNSGKWGQIEDTESISGEEHVARLTINYTAGGVTEYLAGISAGQSAAAGALICDRAIAGVSAGASGTAGALARTRGIAAASAGTSGLSAVISRVRGLLGSSAGQGGLSGALKALWALVGQIAAKAGLSGSLAISGEYYAETIEGNSPVTKAVSGNSTVTKEISGYSIVTKAVSGDSPI